MFTSLIVLHEFFILLYFSTKDYKYVSIFHIHIFIIILRTFIRLTFRNKKPCKTKGLEKLKTTYAHHKTTHAHLKNDKNTPSFT